MKEQEKKYSLIAYKGGGYSGCFWEWNFAFFDKEGKFYDVGSSGRNGCDTEEKLDKLEEYVYYDLSKKEEKIEFQKTYCADFGLKVVQEVNKIIPDTLFMICDGCGREIEEGQLEGWTGAGGIAIRAEEIYCEDCMVNLRCSDCEEISTEGYRIEGDWICDSCLTDYRRPIILPSLEERFDEVMVNLENIKRGILGIAVIPSFSQKQGQEKLLIESQEKLEEIWSEIEKVLD